LVGSRRRKEERKREEEPIELFHTIPFHSKCTKMKKKKKTNQIKPNQYLIIKMEGRGENKYVHHYY
jgi:hypothetical protein